MYVCIYIYIYTCNYTYLSVCLEPCPSAVNAGAGCFFVLRRPLSYSIILCYILLYSTLLYYITFYAILLYYIILYHIRI